MRVQLCASKDCVAPSTVLERELVIIWSDVLGCAPEKIVVPDSFFDLGGHFFFVIQLVLLIKEIIGIGVKWPMF